jgi:hypothetical protein
MRRIVIFICQIVFIQEVFCQQLELKVDNIEVSSVVESSDKNNFTLHNEGPYLGFELTIINHTDSLVVLNPSKASYIYSYTHNGNINTKIVYPLSFMDLEELKLNPGDSANFYVSDSFFFGTSIYDTKKKNYTLDLIKSLPTMKFIYQQKRVRLISNKIISVTIK